MKINLISTRNPIIIFFSILLILTGYSKPTHAQIFYDLAVCHNTVFVGTSQGVFMVADSGMSLIKMNKGMGDKNIKKIRAGNNCIIAVSDSGKIFLSKDMGENWKLIMDCYEPFKDEYYVAVTNSSIYAINKNLLYESNDFGNNWKNISVNGQTVMEVFTLNDKIIAVTYKDFLMSDDKGVSWSQINKGIKIKKYKVNRISNLISIGNTTFIGIDNKVQGEDLQGVYKSDNLRNGWTEVITDKYHYAISLAAIGSTLIAGGHFINLLDIEKGYWDAGKGINLNFIYALAVCGNDVYALACSYSYSTKLLDQSMMYISKTKGSSWSLLKNREENRAENYKLFIENKLEEYDKIFDQYFHGIAHTEYGEYDSAIVSYNNCINLKSDFPEAYSGRGNCYSKMKQNDKASADFLTAENIKKKNIVLKTQLSDSLKNNVFFYKSFETFQTNLKSFPYIKLNYFYKDYTLWAKLAEDNYYKGLYYYAIEEYSNAIKYNDKISEYFIKRAISNAKFGHYSESEADFAKAKNIEPTCCSDATQIISSAKKENEVIEAKKLQQQQQQQQKEEEVLYDLCTRCNGYGYVHGDRTPFREQDLKFKPSERPWGCPVCYVCNGAGKFPRWKKKKK